MLFDVIRSLYQYNDWANHRILIATSKLSPEQFLASAGSSFPSVRDTLVHIMGGEWIWLSRWKGTSPSVMLNATGFPSLPSIQTSWAAIEADTRHFIDQLNPSQLTDVVSYINTSGKKWAYPLWQQMIHQVNHATQHRSEVAAMLTFLGYSPGDLDYLVFQDELHHSK